MVSREASSSISDENGNLLFYTNGVDVYNRSHEIMVNGSGLNGNASSHQGAMIVPRPGNSTIYYIFTADALENSLANGYQYSIVDMSLDNGKGGVTVKNNPLASSGTERMAAVRHANGVDIWVLTNDRFSNIFRTFLVTCAGVQTGPVSTIGEILNTNNDDMYNAGALKFSPDGKMLCHTHFPLEFGSTNPLPDFFQLFDFNTQTGILTNAKKIEVPGGSFADAQFSPNSKLVYVATGGPPYIDQYDVSLPTVPGIINSRVKIPAPPGMYAIQMGPDQKIYVAPTGRDIGVINKPDLGYPGCNYNDKQITLETSLMFAFPQSVSSLIYDPQNGYSVNVLDSCRGIVQFTGSTSMPTPVAWSWDFGDGNTSNIQSPVHTFNPPQQTYKVKLTITGAVGCGVLTQSLLVTPGGEKVQMAFSQFGGCDSGYVRFENHSTPMNGGYFVWDFGDGNTSTELHPTHVYGQAGLYPVKLKLFAGGNSCYNDSIIGTADMLSFTGTVTTSPDREIFEGQTIQLFADGPGNTYLWTPSTGLSNPNIKNPSASPQQDVIYTVRISNASNCFVEKDISIKVVEPRDIYVPNAFTPNVDGKNDLLRPIFGSKYKLEEFSVYNRWGERVFTTSERWAGWDGKINGSLQPTGLYIWTIRILDPTGQLIVRKGNAALIR